jgi:hypothetical protein
MKKLASLLMALCLGAFIVGCGGEEEGAGGGGADPAPATDPAGE